MKNFIFKSSQDSDLLKIFTRVELIQTELRAQRYEHKVMLLQLERCVKGLALLVSAPENNSETLPEEEL